MTGIKAVTGANASSSREAGRKLTAGIEVDASIVGGTPVSLGPEAQVERKKSEGISWDGSSDFVFAYRVQSITLSRSGQATRKNYTTKIVLDKDRRQEAAQIDEGFVLSAPETDDIINAGFKLEDAGGGELCAVPEAS